MKSKLPFYLFEIVSILILLLAGWYLWNWYQENDKIDTMLKNIKQETSIQENYDFDKLLNKNTDTVAWLTVKGTHIDYPVVQFTDNSYYLTHSFDKTINSAGWIFADYRNHNFSEFISKNTVIYGHGRLNQAMFGTLKNVLEENWYKNTQNQQIILTTNLGQTTWKVCSVYKIPAEDYYITTDFHTNEEYEKFLSIIQSRSIYDFNETLNKTDKILTLSTCTNTIFNGRIVLHAKLIYK